MWSNLGRAWYQTSDHVRMEDAYMQAYLNDPRAAIPTLISRWRRASTRKITEAEHPLSNGRKDRPNQREGLVQSRGPLFSECLGVLYFQNDRFAEAEEAFRAAVKHKADYARAWDNLGSTLSAQGKVEEAIEACKQAIHYRPGYPEAYFKLSAIYLDKGDPASLTEAATCLSYVVNYAPLAASANAMLSMIQSRLEQVDSAKASLQRAVKSDPNCDLLPTTWKELETAIRAS